jgi:hypothetical protein
MMDEFDSELRGAFDALRELDRERAITLEDVLGDEPKVSSQPLPPPRRGTRRLWLAATLAAAAMAALLVRPGADGRFTEVLAGAGELGQGWVAPSDFLMRYPGQEFYGQIPSIGEVAPIGLNDEPTTSTNPQQEDNR